MFGVDGMHVVGVTTRDDRMLMLDVETDQTLSGCASCGVVAVGHGRRVVRLHDTPCFGRPVRVRWRKRIWRCAEEVCPVSTWTETHDYAGKRSKLTTRAISWALDALRHDTTVSAIARHPRVDGHTACAAIGAEARRRIKRPERLKSVQALGVGEHIWRPRCHTNNTLTVMVDLPRDADGCLHARLLDAMEGRSGTVYADGLKDEGLQVKVTVEHAALDPFRDNANAIRDELPDAVAVLDAFHAVKLGSTALDEVRRRVPQRPCDAAGTRPTRSIGSAVRGSGRTTPAHRTGPDGAWPSSSSRCCTPARSPSSPSSPGSAGRYSSGASILGQFATGGVNNGGTGAINGVNGEDPRTGPRLPELEGLPATHPARRRRNPALPETTYPCLIPKSPESHS